jgi:hypothetical protein
MIEVIRVVVDGRVIESDGKTGRWPPTVSKVSRR